MLGTLVIWNWTYVTRIASMQKARAGFQVTARTRVLDPPAEARRSPTTTTDLIENRTIVDATAFRYGVGIAYASVVLRGT